MKSLKELWNGACLKAGIPAITTDTAARIMAVVYVHGNNEAFVYNKSFIADVEYIRKRFGLDGGEIPDEDFRLRLKKYIKKLEECEETDEEKGDALFYSHAPEWARCLFKERYGIKIIN